MLIFHSHCQMGNQMFIYACAESISARRKIPFALSETDGLMFFKKPFRNRYLNALKYQLFRIHNKLFPGKYVFHHLQDNRNDYSNILKNDVSKNVWYYGYFQGKIYFFDYEKHIKTLFDIRDKFKRQFELKRKELPKAQKLISVHFRRKDYKTFGPDYLNGPDLSLPFDYYHKILKRIDLTNSNVVFISDEIEEIQKEFAYIKNAIFSRETPIIDFQYLLHSDICIIANSTFGWWGAYLNAKAHKKIYVPEYFLGFKVQKEYPVHIIPNDWEKISVF